MRTTTAEAVSTVDMEFIRLMTAMPTEVKILTRGVILGLGLSEKIQKDGKSGDSAGQRGGRRRKVGTASHAQQSAERESV